MMWKHRAAQERQARVSALAAEMWAALYGSGTLQVSQKALLPTRMALGV